MMFKMISFSGLHRHGLWFTSCSRVLIRTWFDHKSGNGRFSVRQARHYAPRMDSHALHQSSKFSMISRIAFCHREIIEELKVSVGWQSKLILYSISWHQ